MPPPSSLTLDWVQDPEWSWEMPFNVGGLGTMEWALPFDVVGDPIEMRWMMPFNVIGQTTWEWSTPFDVMGTSEWAWSTPFDVLDVVTSPNIGTGTPVGDPETTTSTGAAAGDTSVDVGDATGILPGSMVQVGDDVRAVESVSGSTITFTAALSQPVASGTNVYLISGPVTYGSAPVLTGPISGLLIFDKKGTYLGNIPRGHFTVTGAPSRSVGDTGAMQFAMARQDDGTPDPYLHLLFDDRLVMVVDELGTEPWLGSMTLESWSGGGVVVTAHDAATLWGGPKVKLSETNSTQVSAAAMYQKVIDLMNVQRAADGELVWGIDISCSEAFFGDAVMEGEAGSLFQQIARRSMTEYAWRAALVGNRATATFVARDKFTAPGFAVEDGVDGNVVGGPTLIIDPTPTVHSIRVRGRPTDLSAKNGECSTSGAIDCLDWMTDVEGAATSATRIVPEGFASVDPGPRRRREDLIVQLDWGMAAPDQQAAANDLTAKANAIFQSFLRAFHDRFGRPFYSTDGWQYDGPPADLERFLTTGLGWRTRLKLVEYKGRPASLVMLSDSQKQALIVLYDIRTGAKEVRRVWFNELAGTMNVTKMSINGTARIWTVVGGVITGYRWTTFNKSMALVGPPITYMWPREDAEGAPSTSYKTLRRVVSISEDGAVTEAMYFDSDPALIGNGALGTPYKTFSTTTITSSLEMVDLGKMYDFELRSLCDWDPRRDGIGAQLNKTTVIGNQPSTSMRWHFIPWGDGSGTTAISMGITASETKIYVENAFVLPQTYPYTATLGDGLNAEDVTVTAGSGTLLTITRGANGTTPIIHPTGTSFAKKPDCDTEPAADDDENTTYVPWPEGKAWAERLLEELQHPVHRLTVQVTNDNNEWAKVRYGSVLAVNIQSEGPPGGIVGNWRVLGWAPNYHEGTMELLVEEVR